jgi:hypothetical protein
MMAPCMNEKKMEFIIRIRDWYLMEHNTDVRVYGVMKPPHLLPQFVIDKLLL